MVRFCNFGHSGQCGAFWGIQIALSTMRRRAQNCRSPCATPPVSALDHADDEDVQANGEAGRHRRERADFAQNGAAIIDEIDEEDQREIEDIAAQYIADGELRTVAPNRGDGARSLAQRGGCGEEQKAEKLLPSPVRSANTSPARVTT